MRTWPLTKAAKAVRPQARPRLRGPPVRASTARSPSHRIPMVAPRRWSSSASTTSLAMLRPKAAA